MWPRKIKQLVLLSIIELRIPCFDPRKSLPTPDYRPIIGGIRRNREMPFPLVLSNGTLESAKLIGFSFLETYLHSAEHVQRTYGMRRGYARYYFV